MALCHSRENGNPGKKEWIPDQVGDDRHESGMTDVKKPKVGRLFDETAG